MKWRIAFTVLVVVGIFGFASASDRPQPKYSFAVRPSANGIELECKSGCAWKALKATCPKGPCEFHVDEFGLQGR